MIKSPRLSALFGAICFVFAAASVAPAQIPGGYYNSVDTTNATTLRASLHAVIDDHKIFPYTSGATDTWDILKKADQDPTNSSRILDVYKNEDYQKVNGGSGSYNREHTWPNSLGFPNDNGHNYPYNDCHQLFLCDISYNGIRGSKPFGQVGGSGAEITTVFNHGVGGGSGSYPGFSNWSNSSRFEVWSDRRGDVARAMLYMDVRYAGGNHGSTGWSEPNLILTDNASLISNSATGSNESVAYMGMRSVLLQWHAQDPVDAKEIVRNNKVHDFQGNRNPFIDHPEWVDCLFNGSCGVDTVPPAPPVGVSVGVNGGTLSLDWADNSEGDLAGYHVWRSLVSGAGYGEVSSGLHGPSSFVDSNVNVGTTYYYVVTAEDQVGNISAFSAEVSGVPAGGVGTGIVWINELHYDNGGSDVGEFVEVAGPAGTDLAGYSLVGYNGNGGVVYSTVPLTGVLPDQGGCVGTLAFLISGLQNGDPDGIALVGTDGGVIELLSYEGSFTATNGPATGMLSIDIGVEEDSATLAGESLQRGGTGAAPGDFSWQTALAETPGASNQNQSFAGGCQVVCGVTQYGVGASAANTISLAGNFGPGVLNMQATSLPAGTVGAYFGVSNAQASVAQLGGVVLIDAAGLLLAPFFAPISPVPDFLPVSLAIPAIPGLAGLEFDFQCFAFDASQPASIALSNGLMVVICP